MSTQLQSLPTWRQRRSVHMVITHTLYYLILATVGAMLMVPFLWMVVSSVKAEHEIFSIPTTWIPERIRWENYTHALESFPFFRALLNTLFITMSVIVGRLLSTSLAAYAFARMRFRLRTPLFVLVLSTLMIPYHVTLIPTYILFTKLGWIDTFLPLIVPNWLGLGAFYIFLLRQFFMTVPSEMNDAARIDGCSHFGIFARVILPLSIPALATVTIFTFLEQWNDFLAPIIYLNSPDKHTLAIAIQFYRQSASGAGWGPVRTWAHLMVVSLLTMAPCLLLFFFAQRYFIQGVVISGVKG